MDKKLLLSGIVLLSVGMCFGAAFFHWNCSRLRNCGSPLGFFDAGAPASEGTRLKAALLAVPGVGGVPAAATGGTEEHLLKLQETVLNEIEASNTKTKEMLDFALLVVGFVGSLVLARFGGPTNSKNSWPHNECAARRGLTAG